LVHDQALALDLKQQDLLTMCAARAAAEIGRLRAEQALAERLRVEKEMARCACTLLADADPTQTLTVALGHLLATTTGGTLSLYDFVGTAADLALQLVAHARGHGHEQLPAPVARSLIHPELSRWYQELSQGLMISSPVRLLLAEEQASLYQQGVRSVLVIPLRSHDRTIGLLRVDHHIEEHRWTREEVALIRGGADLLVAYVLSRRVSQSAKEGRS
jgi:GAF domain-containing protein